MTKKDGDKLRDMANALHQMSKDYGHVSEEGISMNEIACAIDDLLAGKRIQLIAQ